MNKVLKGLVAVAATAAMAVAGFAGASTAMADTTNKTNITISDATNGDEFSAYRLLNLTTSAEGATTNYSYTVNNKYQTVLKQAINELNGDAAGAPTTDAEIIDYITKNVASNDSTDATKEPRVNSLKPYARRLPAIHRLLPMRLLLRLNLRKRNLPTWIRATT